MNRLESAIVGFFHSVNRLMTQFAKLLGIWIADGVVAYQTAANLMADLHWSLPGAVLAGLALECVGILVADTALSLRRFNQAAKHRRALSMELVAWAMVVLQFAASVVLMVFNTITGLTLYGLLVLAVLSGIGTLSHMLDQDREHREVEESAAIAAEVHQAQLAQRRAERSQRRVEQPVNVPTAFSMTPQFERVVQYYREHPGVSFRTAAQALERPLASVYSDVNALCGAGMLEKRNGHGVHAT